MIALYGEVTIVTVLLISNICIENAYNIFATFIIIHYRGVECAVL